MTARRAVARWAWRLFRRQWRQQLLVLGLLTASVAIAVGFVSATYTTTPVPDNADFGAATHLVRISGEPDLLRADLAAAEAWFDDYEIIYHRDVRAPGLLEPVDYRTQEPAGPLGGPRLTLAEGAYPADGQVAVTDDLAQILGTTIGGSIDLDGMARVVVGVVENPGNLGDEFVLLPAAETGQPDSVTILANGTDDHVLQFRPPSGATVEVGSRLTNQDLLAAVATLVLAVVGLFLVALIAAASFVVIAQRRMRQLGMLAAIGATEKQLRIVTLTNGAVLGVVAAIVGAAAGFAGWVTVSSLVENAVGYRVDELAVPWWLIVCAMLLAVAAGVGAAWWPARSVARVPTVRALSGRPPEPKPVRRAAALAVLFGAVGVASLVAGSGGVATDGSVSGLSAVLIVAGTVAVALGMLFACPLAVRLLPAGAGRLPVAVRLAFGDLARYRARSGAALAAISLILGVSVTIVATTAAAAAPDGGNLPEHQVLIRAEHVGGPFVPEAGELAGLTAAAERVAAAFDDPQVTSLEVAMDPASEPDPAFNGRLALTIAERFEDGWRDVSLLYLATPSLLAGYGLDLDTVPAGTTVITREAGEFGLVGEVGAERRSMVGPATGAARLELTYDSLPGTFVTAEVVGERGWVTVPSGRWLVDTGTPPTTEQLAAAREAAAGAGLAVEVRDDQAGLGRIRSGATAAGMLAALGIIAMAVGLVRGEAGRDLRLLTATGATRGTRRTLTAATAGGLAVLGVVVGTAGAYAGLAAGYARDLGVLAPVPVAHLAVIVLGLPLIAVLAGWLVSGRNVADIARQPIE